VQYAAASIMKSQLLFSKRQAAEALSVSLRTIDYLIHRNQLAVTRIGRRVLIQWEVLEQFAKASSQRQGRPICRH
jgi:excisionase family DNA binding protein